MWKKYDVDNNGYLDEVEGKKFILESHALIKVDNSSYTPPTDAEVDEAFDKFDRDDDMKIEKHELIKHLLDKL